MVLFKVKIKLLNASQQSFYRCKVCYCDEHIKRRGFKYAPGEPFPCPKCNYPTRETKDLAMSSKENKHFPFEIKISFDFIIKLELMSMEEKLKMIMKMMMMMMA